MLVRAIGRSIEAKSFGEYVEAFSKICLDAIDLFMGMSLCPVVHKTKNLRHKLQENKVYGYLENEPPSPLPPSCTTHLS